MRTLTFRISGVLLVTLPGIIPFLYKAAPNLVSLSYLLLLGSVVSFVCASGQVSDTEVKTPRERSLDACEQASLRLQRWTRDTVITEENFGYHKQLVGEFERLIERHLKQFSSDRELPRFRSYRWYIHRSYDFTIKRF